MKQGHMAIKTQEHEDFNDTRTREHKGTWAHGHLGTWPNEHKDTRTQGHKNIRTTTSTSTRTTTREDEAAAFCGVDGAQKYRYRWRRGRWSNGGGWGGI
jgi:hypothetical protein